MKAVPYREPDEINRAVTRSSASQNECHGEQSTKLYEERIIADTARKGGKAVDKHVETESVQVSVPIDKERWLSE